MFRSYLPDSWINDYMAFDGRYLLTIEIISYYLSIIITRQRLSYTVNTDSVYFSIFKLCFRQRGHNENTREIVLGVQHMFMFINESGIDRCDWSK